MIHKFFFCWGRKKKRDIPLQWAYAQGKMRNTWNAPILYAAFSRYTTRPPPPPPTRHFFFPQFPSRVDFTIQILFLVCCYGSSAFIIQTLLFHREEFMFFAESIICYTQQDAKDRNTKPWNSNRIDSNDIGHCCLDPADDDLATSAKSIRTASSPSSHLEI